MWDAGNAIVNTNISKRNVYITKSRLESTLLQDWIQYSGLHDQQLSVNVMFIIPKVGLRAHFWLLKKLVAG